MATVYGHRKCKSEAEVVPASDFARHQHGSIGNDGKIAGVTTPMLLMTDGAGNIIAAREIDADMTFKGTLTAAKIVGAVYM